MIDVDVVKDVDENYARDVHGVAGALIDCFALGVIPAGHDDWLLPEPVRNNNIAVSFTQSLADFFYEFAEKHFHLKESDEVVLLAAKIDCNQMDEESIIACFFERAETAVNSGDCIVIKRREALCPGSDEVAGKVRKDIYLQRDRSLLAKEEIQGPVTEHVELKKVG